MGGTAQDIDQTSTCATSNKENGSHLVATGERLFLLFAADNSTAFDEDLRTQSIQPGGNGAISQSAAD